MLNFGITGRLICLVRFLFGDREINEKRFFEKCTEVGLGLNWSIVGMATEVVRGK